MRILLSRSEGGAEAIKGGNHYWLWEATRQGSAGDARPEGFFGANRQLALAARGREKREGGKRAKKEAEEVLFRQELLVFSGAVAHSCPPGFDFPLGLFAPFLPA